MQNRHKPDTTRSVNESFVIVCGWLWGGYGGLWGVVGKYNLQGLTVVCDGLQWFARVCGGSVGLLPWFAVVSFLCGLCFFGNNNCQ
jgi:hypothetical protein